MTSGRAGARRWVAAAVVVTAVAAWGGTATAALGADATLDAVCAGETWTASLAVTNADTRGVSVAALAATGVAPTAFAPLAGGIVLAPGATVAGAADGLARSLAGVSVTVTLTAGGDTVVLLRTVARPEECAPVTATTSAVGAPGQPVVAGTVPVTASREASGITVDTTAAPATAAPATTATSPAPVTAAVSPSVPITAASATATAPATTVRPSPSVSSTSGPSVSTSAGTRAGTSAATALPGRATGGVASGTGAAPAGTSAGAPATPAVTVAGPGGDGSPAAGWIGAVLVVAALAGALLLVLAWRRRRPRAWVLPSVPLPPIMLDPPPALQGSGVFVAAADDDRDALDAVVAELRANGYLVSSERALAEAGATSVRVATAHAVEHAMALVLLVSPAAQRSPEVARQVALADDAGRDVVALLIDGSGEIDGPLRLFLADTDLIDGRGAAHRRGMNTLLQILQAKVARRLASPPPPGAAPHRAPTALASQ